MTPSTDTPPRPADTDASSPPVPDATATAPGRRTSDAARLRRVAIFRTNVLSISETFIRNQACAIRAWQPLLVGFEEAPVCLATPGIARHLAPPERSRILRALRTWAWRPHTRLVQLLREQDVALVHAHFGTDATDIWPSVRAAGLPMIVTLHGYDINVHREWWESGHGGRHRRAYPQRLLKMARDPAVSFIAVSDAIRRRAIDYGIPPSKVAVAYIGVDVERFRPAGLPLAQRPRRILFVGRMVEKKAPLTMIRAFARVREHVHDAELAMIGEGPLLQEARLLADALGAPVQFLGSRSSDEVLAQLHEARIFCLPSLTAGNGDAEGLPIAILEAQACGVPVVTSVSGGSLEGIRDSETGCALPSHDADAAARILARLLVDDAALSRMGHAASAFMRSQFDIDRCTRTLEQIYDERAGSR